MSSNQPVAGSLSMKVIRACPVHAQCALECPERSVEDLGTVASFDNTSIVDRLKEGLSKWHQSSHQSARP